MTTDERLEKVERQLARVRWFNRCLIACIVLSLVVWGLTRTFGPETAWAKSKVKEIRANAFILQDENGKDRALLQMTEAGPMLGLDDEKGKPCVLLSVTKEGPTLMLTDTSSKGGVALSVREARPGLQLDDETGKTRVRAGMSPTGPVVSLSDANDKPRISLSLLKDEACLAVAEEGGKYVMLKGDHLALRDESGRVRAFLGLAGEGPALTLARADGKALALLAQKNADRAGLVLLDENGKAIWESP